jgi:hypothetical protein
MTNKFKRRIVFGTITPALLVITGASLTVLYGILFVLAMQFDYSNRQVGSESALHIAEAGVNYYRWHLAHDPVDFTGGTGEHEYTDPEGNVVGNSVCWLPAKLRVIHCYNKIYRLDISVSKVKRSISVQYGILFARYSFSEFKQLVRRRHYGERPNSFE